MFVPSFRMSAGLPERVRDAPDLHQGSFDVARSPDLSGIPCCDGDHRLVVVDRLPEVDNAAACRRDAGPAGSAHRPRYSGACSVSPTYDPATARSDSHAGDGTSGARQRALRTRPGCHRSLPSHPQRSRRSPRRQAKNRLPIPRPSWTRRSSASRPSHGNSSRGRSIPLHRRPNPMTMRRQRCAWLTSRGSDGARARANADSPSAARYDRSRH